MAQMMRGIHADIVASFSLQPTAAMSDAAPLTEVVESTADKTEQMAQMMRGIHADIVDSFRSQKRIIDTTSDRVKEGKPEASPLTQDEQLALNQIEASLAQSNDTLYAPPVAERRSRGRRIGRVVGTVALTGALFVVGVGGSMIGQSLLQGGSSSEQVETSPSPAQAEEPTTQPSNETLPLAEPTAATTEATTTTTEFVPYSAEEGQLIGTLSMPNICEDSVEIYAQHENNMVQDGTTGEWSFAVDAPINYRNPDATPRADCVQTAGYAASQRAGSNPGYRQRPERDNKVSNQGSAAQWQPVAVHEMNDTGILSVYPGQGGNAVLMGHGSTYSAAFADTGALQPGNEVVFSRSDGKQFTYRAVGYEIMPAGPESRNQLYNWSHPDSPATLTLFSCSNAEGEPGSSTHRLVWRFVLDTPS
jgi:sortase (surface protein transpeptidase)